MKYSEVLKETNTTDIEIVIVEDDTLKKILIALEKIIELLGG